MEISKEIQNHIKALGEWASQDNRRALFVCCGEITEDGAETCNVLVGRTDRISCCLYGTSESNGGIKLALDIANAMKNDPLIAMYVQDMASKDETPAEAKKSEPGNLKSKIAEILEELAGKLKE